MQHARFALFSIALALGLFAGMLLFMELGRRMGRRQIQKRGPAARALLDLACRLHDGRVVLPPEPDAPRTAAGRLRAALRRRTAAFGVLRSGPARPTERDQGRAVPSPAGAALALAAVGGSDE